MDTPSVPNQQIVVQFSDAHITLDETENAIKAIQSKLQIIGASSIQVGQDQKGQLKITYYSDSDIHQIEKTLSNQEYLKLALNKDNSKTFPEQKDTKDYKLNVSEIQPDQSNDWGFKGVQVSELNHKSDRFNNLDHNSSNFLIQAKLLDQLAKTVVRFNNNRNLVLDKISYKIPEVRAGPSV